MASPFYLPPVQCYTSPPPHNQKRVGRSLRLGLTKPPGGTGHWFKWSALH